MTTGYNTQRLIQSLTQEYEVRFPRSKAAHAQARHVLVDGVSHDARLFAPFPFRIRSAEGAYVTDLDGHKITDFWQGHYANILGHNPAVIRDALIKELNEGAGLQTGIPDEREAQFAEELANATGAERVRFTTAGTLSTMYAIMLARAYTGRKLILKVGGGWHGAQPLALKGVGRSASGFDKLDSAGMSSGAGDEIVIARYNDPEDLARVFRAQGDHNRLLYRGAVHGSSRIYPLLQRVYGYCASAHQPVRRAAHPGRDHHRFPLLCLGRATLLQRRARPHHLWQGHRRRDAARGGCWPRRRARYGRQGFLQARAVQRRQPFPRIHSRCSPGR